MIAASKGRPWAKIAAVGVLALVAIVVSQIDWLMVERRLNLPKELPWPYTYFQPQEAVRGGQPAQLSVVPAEERTINAEAIEAAQQYAAEIKSSALLVSHRGRLQVQWYGPGMGADSITHTYNLQYTPLVLLMGIAIAEGKIASADEPASTYITEWKGDDRSKITIRNLLQMNAGLDLRFDASYSKWFFSRDARAYWGSHTKDVIVTYPTTTEPGKEFNYNYIIPELLGIILERATGKRYADYLTEKLWQPLGNKTAYLWLNRAGGESHQDAGLFSTPTDWLNIGELLLNNGNFAGRELVPAAWIAEMRKPSATNPNYGFMYLGSPYAAERRMATDKRVTYTVKSSEPFLADDVSYVDGYGGQRVYVVPSKQLVVVRIGEVERAYDNAKLVNTLLRGLAE
jgi:CubicO group peptidase (beta-lactamase class C family)